MEIIFNLPGKQIEILSENSITGQTVNFWASLCIMSNPICKSVFGILSQT